MAEPITPPPYGLVARSSDAAGLPLEQLDQILLSQSSFSNQESADFLADIYAGLARLTDDAQGLWDQPSA
jgi:hypothetical protein